MTPTPRPALRFWPAVALSLAIHGCIAALLFRCSAWGGGEPAGSPLAVDACALAADDVAPIPLAAREPPGPAGQGPAPTPQPVAVVPTLTPQPEVMASATSARIIPDFAQKTSTVAVARHADPPRGPFGSGTGRGGGMGTGGVVTAFFATPARGSSVVYVVDRSSSMGVNGALDAVKRELVASLDRLPEDARFQVVFYNRQAEALAVAGQSGMLRATATNKLGAAGRVESLTAEGGTEHLAALRRALSFQPDVIFFLTDADDLTPQTVQAVTRLNQGRASIHTIELTTANRGRDDMPLHVLAHQNRGEYRAVSFEP